MPNVQCLDVDVDRRLPEMTSGLKAGACVWSFRTIPVSTIGRTDCPIMPPAQRLRYLSSKVSHKKYMP